MTASSTLPPPAIVRYNDWRRIPVAAPDAFTPALPVSVVVSHYEAPEALARTLAALETQDWPRELFEVVIVDDGSRLPPEPPASTPLDVRVVRQEHRGFGPARARNNGVRAAAHDILLFLDGDMLPEPGWIAAHARWHHAASGLLTLGFRAHVSVDGIGADSIRERAGTLDALFAGRPADPPFFERHMTRTGELTSRDDDVFRVVTSCNLGIRRELFDAAGGFDESFTRWGGEDTEFGYRVCTLGGVLVPVRSAFAWHQGRRAEDWERKKRMQGLQRLKIAHLIAHEDFRDARPGRGFAVPQHVVTVETANLPAERVIETAETVLADQVHDLIVRIELPEGDPRLDWVREDFGADSRVRAGPPASALDEFPFAPFHVAVFAGAVFAPGLVHRLRCELGPAAVVHATLDDGSTVAMHRAWALHRARRTGRPASDFGEVVTTTARRLRIAGGNPAPDIAGATLRRWLRGLRIRGQMVFGRLRRIRAPRHARGFVRWLARATRARASHCGQLLTGRRTPSAVPGGSDLPLGAEIAALGPHARAVFHATRRVAPRIADRHLDVVLCDSPAEAPPARLPAVVLSHAAAQLSVPAFDPRVDNPVGWVRGVPPVVAALGPLERLPAGAAAQRIVDPRDRVGLRWCHHLEDVQAFHANVVERAGELARLAANGVVIHLADRDARLRPHLGGELHDLMLAEARGVDTAVRQSLSIRMRRAALRGHSLQSRARQISEAAGLPDPPRLPLVSILLVTKRPEWLPGALSTITRQRYPRLELILGLHGEGFDRAERLADAVPIPSTIVRAAGHVPFGSVLNAAGAAATGTLLTKMDDDDLYDPEHIWDLMLAHEYSGAQLVGKGQEFVYIAGADRTVHRLADGGERYVDVRNAFNGGALLIARDDLARAGGWRRVPGSVDSALIEDVLRVGGRVYRTHGTGVLIVRHGRRHTWKTDDARFLEQAEAVRRGWDPALAGLSDVAQAGTGGAT